MTTSGAAFSVLDYHTDLLKRRNDDTRRLILNEVRTMLDTLAAERCANILRALGHSSTEIQRAEVVIDQIRFQITEFEVFATSVDVALEGDFSTTFLNKARQAPGTDEQAHKQERACERVVNFIALQWSVLRAMALQRMPGSPYLLGQSKALCGITHLDAYTETLFSQLLTGLNKLDADLAQGKLFPKQGKPTQNGQSGLVVVLRNAYPMLYLGGCAKVQFIGEIPPIVSLPLAALYVDETEANARPASEPVPTLSEDAAGPVNPDAATQPIYRRDDQAMFVGHELGHILLNQVPELLDQIQSALLINGITKLSKPVKGANGQLGLSLRKRMILLNLIQPWLEELLADLFGAVLLGAPFISESLELGAAPGAPLAGASQGYPPGILRPWLMLHMFEELKARYANTDRVVPDTWARLQNALDAVKTEVEQRTQASLGEPFDLPDTVAIIRQQDVLDLPNDSLIAQPAKKPNRPCSPRRVIRLANNAKRMSPRSPSYATANA